MRSLFARAPAPLLGVDVGASNIKVVELSRTSDGWVLEHCATEPLERGWIVGGVVDRFDEVAAALRRAVRQSGSKARHAAMALPFTAVITRRVLLPADADGLELELLAEEEASHHIPFPLEDVSFDFCPTGKPVSASGEKEMLIVASRRERVQDCAGLAEAASLKAVIVEVETHASRLAALRLIKSMGWPQGEAVALVDVRASSTLVQVLKQGDVVHERDHAFGGELLTQMLVRHYGMTAQEADARARARTLPEDASASVLPEFTLAMAQEIGRALQFFVASSSIGKVDRILLAGGTASVAGLDIAVALETGARCLRLNPFEGMAVGPHVPSAQSGPLGAQASAYLVACGLALRRFDA